jgi:hypothetical protein
VNSKNLGFRGNERNPLNQRGQSHEFTPTLEIDDEAHPSIQTHGRNRRKTPQIVGSKIRPKIPPKIMKIKNITV